MRAWSLVVGLLLVSSVTGADEKQEQRARALFTDGKSAFEREDFQRAYDAFEQAYLLSQEPALLYNMASSLQSLSRPHDAAECLRSYLRALPDDPDRALIEGRIRALEESQRLLDAHRSPPAPIVPAPTPIEPPPTLQPEPTLVSAPQIASAPPAPQDKTPPVYRRWWLWTVVAVVVAGAALGVGLGVGLSSNGDVDRSHFGTRLVF